MDFVHVAISPKDAPPALAIFRKLRYNSISVSGCSCTDAGFQDAHFIWRMSAWRTAMEQNKNDARLVFLSRRAYETGRIHLVFFQDQVWDARDTGWQLLEGSGACKSRKQPAGICYAGTGTGAAFAVTFAARCSRGGRRVSLGRSSRRIPPDTIAGGYSYPVITLLGSAFARIM